MSRFEIPYPVQLEAWKRGAESMVPEACNRLQPLYFWLLYTLLDSLFFLFTLSSLRSLRSKIFLQMIHVELLIHLIFWSVALGKAAAAGQASGLKSAEAHSFRRRECTWDSPNEKVWHLRGWRFTLQSPVTLDIGYDIHLILQVTGSSQC